MALNSYLACEGETQGPFNGSCTQAGRENKIEIIGWSHELVSPRDAASGLPTGKRQHKPFTVTAQIDKATPLLHKALVDNENIPKWKLNCWKPSSAGKELNFYDIELVNANVAGIRSEMLNNKYPENMKHGERNHISFTYQKIIWTWVDGGITAEDDWETPVA
jgi:type VI secretion system secreted protein Hcp